MNDYIVAKSKTLFLGHFT